MYGKVTCEECKKRLGDDYLICADKVADLFYWDDKENKFVIPRETKLVLVKDWKQTINRGSWEKKKSTQAYWKTSHGRIRLTANDDESCVIVYNPDNSRSESIRLCKLPKDIFKIEGPGAKAHEEQDRVRILELQLKKETELRKKAEAEAAEERDNRTAEKLKSRFDAMGVGVFEKGVRVHRPFHSSRASGIHLSFEAAEIVLYNLEGLDDAEFLKKALDKLEKKAS
jgi:hypothetical protein